MEGLKKLERRKLIASFYEKHREMVKHFTFRYFSLMGLKKSTIYDVMKRVDNNIPLKREVGSGRPAVKMPKKRVKQLINAFDGRVGCSQAKQSLRFAISQSLVSRILKKNVITYYKRQSKPKVTEKQKTAKEKVIKTFEKRIWPKKWSEYCYGR